jgi:hypothetical protein
MKHLLRKGKLLIVGLVLAVSGLTIAATASPAAHAASQPTITAYGGAGNVEVTGSGFASGALVHIVIYDTAGNFVTGGWTYATTAHLQCQMTTSGPRCFPVAAGTIDAYVGVPYYGYVQVTARDHVTLDWSNTSTTYVRILP